MFIETQYDQAEMDKMDMHSLNLFGVPLEDKAEAAAGRSKETQTVLRELIELTEQVGGSTISNFNVRKSFVYYDPYEPDESITYSYLKFEDEHKLRASVVLDFYRKEVEAIEAPSHADKERKQQVLKLVQYLGQLKVVDAPVLLKLYDLHRYKL